MQNKKIFQNAKWIVFCKAMQAVVQFVVGMLSARYLGPSNYGLISYASSVVAFFVPVMQLGLSSTLVQEYVATPEKEGKILGTQLVMTMVSAIACMVGVFAFSAISHPGEPVTILVCVLYSITLLFQALELMQYWFQAKLLSKYSSLATLCAYVAMSAYKIYLLISGKSVYWFAVSHAAEYCVTGVILLWAYKKYGSQKMAFSWPLAKEMFAKSKYYIVAAIMVVVFNAVANIFLVQIHGETENGFYAAAATCVGAPTFVFLAIIDTARPVILESRGLSREAFERNVIRLYAMVVWLSVAQSVAFTIFASLIIRILYGAEYLPAIPVLQILVWNRAFSYMGYVRNIWILGEEKHKVLWIINLCGAVVSIALNALLIPRWGARGAAVASVLVQIFTNLVMGFILKPIRRNNYLLIKGLNPRYILELLPLLKK